MITPNHDIAVSCANLNKSFRLYDSPAQMASDILGLPRVIGKGGPIREFVALKNINFDVMRGERVAIVGLNGAGKTTLLRLVLGAVNGNFSPSHGVVIVNGDVQALMHGGVSFHPELSGRENVRVELLYKGLSGATLNRAITDVIDFAELDEFLDQPMATYSLGMQARLQFAVATAVQPDILIIDEVLGAGDAYFTMKSADRMRRLAFSGCTLLFVSHSPHHILQFCDRAIWLDGGSIFRDGPCADIMNEYEAAVENSGVDVSAPSDGGLVTLDDGRRVYRWPGVNGVKIRRLEMKVNDKSSETVKRGDRVEFEFELEAERSAKYGCRYLITIWSSKGDRVARIENDIDDIELVIGERRIVRASIDPWLIEPGEYGVSFSIYDRMNFVSTTISQNCRYDVIARGIRILAGISEPVARDFLFDHPSRWSCSSGSGKHGSA